MLKHVVYLPCALFNIDPVQHSLWIVSVQSEILPWLPWQSMMYITWIVLVRHSFCMSVNKYHVNIANPVFINTKPTSEVTTIRINRSVIFNYKKNKWTLSPDLHKYLLVLGNRLRRSHKPNVVGRCSCRWFRTNSRGLFRTISAAMGIGVQHSDTARLTHWPRDAGPAGSWPH